MKNMQFVEEMGLLAELSYVDFKNQSLLGIENENNDWQNNAEQDIILDEDVRKSLINLFDTYELVDFVNHDGFLESDLQMMLFKNGNDYVIAYRGTAGIHDTVITDIASIVSGIYFLLIFH